MHEVRRPLLTPDEYLRMPDPKKDDRHLITAPGERIAIWKRILA